MKSEYFLKTRRYVMKEVRTEEAEGMVLCHDITEIVRGIRKGPAFRKGHVIAADDIPRLLDLGKRNIYVYENDGSMLHEDDAAEILRQLAQGSNLSASQPKEGRIDLSATIDGLFISDTQSLRKLNSFPEISIASRLSGFPVRNGDRCAGMRVIPLMITRALMETVSAAAPEKPLFSVLPFRKLTYGVVTTGSEVYTGRIKDTFTPVIEEKLSAFGCTMGMHEISDDSVSMTAEAIRKMADSGMDMILCTGGMSVDPDDRTPAAIRAAGADIISYGAPVLPGAMFLISYLPDGRPVLGLPGCVMYSRRTVFDIVLPRLLAGLEITADWLAGLGNGGLCLSCPDCRYPDCTFGKGI